MNPLRSRPNKAIRRGRREDAFGVTAAETIIGAGVKLRGDLIGEGDMIIDGTIRGNIQTAGDVTIGVNGQVLAPIKAINVTISGEVEGTITTEGEVSIRETGRLTGDVIAAGISISPGGIFNGRSTIQQHHELEIPVDTEEA